MPFPLTTIGIVVGVCVLFIITAFVAWCCHDMRRSNATVHPAQHVETKPPHVVAVAEAI